MCGICGILYLNNDQKADASLLESMTNTMTHRGPDDIGLHIDGRLGFGMRRLSVIDLVTGHQPIHSEDKSIHVILNGEIYNFQELRSDLEARGHRFYTKSDTESIVHLYEEYGQECVQKLRGMFAFAVWDNKRQTLFIARDRLGVKPLYYYKGNGVFLFASEIKAFLKYRPMSKDINCAALDEYLTYQYIPAPNTIFENVHKLLPAHTITVKNNDMKIERYWKADFSSETSLSQEDCVKTLGNLLEQSVKMRLISDVPLGVFLSGGLDSSGIVAIMSKFSSKPVKTYSVGFDVGGLRHNELEYAKLVAKRFGCDHHEIMAKADMAHTLPKIIEHLDEPMSDAACVPVYFMSQLARESVTVVLTGEGADELFGGYIYYGYGRLQNIYRFIPRLVREEMIERVFKALPKYTPGKNYIKKLSLDPYQRYMGWNAVFKPEEKDGLYGPGLKNILLKDEGWNRLYWYFADKKADPLEILLNFDINVLLPDDFLMKTDRMSMAHSLEARVPYLDHKLVEFAMSLPADLKVRKATEKFILKKAYEGILPKSIVDRKKHGFDVPIAYWLKNELKGMTDELLSDENIKKRGYFNPGYIRQLIKEFRAGKNVSPRKIWNLMSLELWHQIFIDG